MNFSAIYLVFNKITKNIDNFSGPHYTGTVGIAMHAGGREKAMRDNRRKEIAAYIARRQSVTMQELCETFHVSMNTIRADVAFLEEAGTDCRAGRSHQCWASCRPVR